MKNKIIAVAVIVFSLTGAACQTLPVHTESSIQALVSLPQPTGPNNHPDIQPESDISLLDWLAEQPGWLNNLVAEATDKNHSLQSQAARVLGSAAQARIVGAPKLPSVQLTSSINRSKTASTGINNAFSIGPTINWEADVWGRLSARHSAALSDSLAVQEDYRAANLSLAANVIKAIIQLLDAQSQLALAEQSLASFQQSLAIIEDAYTAGVGSALDIRLSRANVASTEANVVALLRSTDNASRQLQLLLGRYPDGTLRLQQQLPAPQALTVETLPITLLERRPDLRAAKQRLNALGYTLASERRNLLPSISFRGTASTNGTEFKDLFDWDTLLWNLLANIASPVLQGDKLSSQRNLAASNYDAALHDYARLAQLAFSEMESGLSNRDLLLKQIAVSEVAATESMAAEQLAEEQYQNGLADVITLLEAQRRSYGAQQDLLSLQAQQLNNQINLLLALGLSNQGEEK